jgi:hypothetical protein
VSRSRDRRGAGQAGDASGVAQHRRKRKSAAVRRLVVGRSERSRGALRGVAGRGERRKGKLTSGAPLVSCPGRKAKGRGEEVGWVEP